MVKALKCLCAVALFAPAIAFAAKFPVRPMVFDGSESQKAKVVEFITKNVYDQYCTRVDMCQESTLRRLERKELEAFKALTHAENRKILDQVISDYCDKIDMCTFTTIKRMYDKNLSASQQKLTW